MEGHLQMWRDTGNDKNHQCFRDTHPMSDTKKVKNFTIVISNLLESSEVSSIFLVPVSQLKLREVEKLVPVPYLGDDRTSLHQNLLTARLPPSSLYFVKSY